ncbi:MAG: two-component system response regulator [Cellulomonas sp. 73-145]|uniref:response regulator transcription factor n=1 Tax=Cellulomonas sp. 73-145 TaxID=1895739 RepID=UPI00092CA95D|nr:response regulator transcription factor [Cellulomonas sp. 73-145]MBN9326211.1 response regulator transcription factor [Cellulomonas sp.]OJV57458.1 MAG: two-component system response regulator [Cellulomonas sp. 73-145]
MTAPTRRLSLLLLEDDPRLAPVVAELLSDVYDVTLVADGAVALEHALTGEFDLLVLDRRVPTLDGLEVVRRLRARHVATPVLLLTALGTTADLVAGLDAGADDYLVKPFELDELLARLRALTRDHTGPEKQLGRWTYHPGSGEIHSPYTGRILLTVREDALLGMLAAEPGRVFSRPQILAAVFPHGEAEGTVDAYVHYLRRKTDRDLIETVRGRGYRLGNP